MGRSGRWRWRPQVRDSKRSPRLADSHDLKSPWHNPSKRCHSQKFKQRMIWPVDQLYLFCAACTSDSARNIWLTEICPSSDASVDSWSPLSSTNEHSLLQVKHSLEKATTRSSDNDNVTRTRKSVRTCLTRECLGFRHKNHLRWKPAKNKSNKVGDCECKTVDT